MTDRKITITLPKKKKPKRSNGSGSLHRGPIRTERRPEYLSRRRKAGGNIFFYDLGYIKQDDDFVTRATSLAADDFDPPTSGADELRDFYNYPLTLDVETWKDTFYKVTSQYRFRVGFIRGSETVNAGDEFLEPGNPKWNGGYLLTEPFDGLDISDQNYLFHAFQATSSSSSQLVTSEPDPTAESIQIPELDPANGEINIFLSPESIRVDTEEPTESPSPGTFGEYSLQVPAYSPSTPACPPVPDEIDLGWSQAMVAVDGGYSDSGTRRSAKTEYLTPLDRADALEDLLIESSDDDFPEIGARLNYLAQALEFDYFLTEWAYSGLFVSCYPRWNGDEPEIGGEPGTLFINRNFLCYDGHSLPVLNGTGTNSVESSSSTSTDSTSAFTFDDDFLGGEDTPMELIPANQSTGSGGALIAAVNQGENWYFIWHVRRFVIG